MCEIMVGLEGPAASLAKMPARFLSLRLTITDEGHGTGYLKSSDFPSSADNAPIIEVAKRLVQVANGVMRQDDPMFFEPVSVRSIVVREDDGGNRTTSISVSMAAAIATALPPTLVELLPDDTTRFMAGPPEPPQPPLEDIALALSGEDAVVAALGFYAYLVNWAVNLYKVYEIVGLDVEETKRGRKSTLSDNKERFIQRGWDEIAKQGWVTRDAIDRFTRTVHSSEVLGEQARHAVQTRPVPADPMNEDEAKKFIGTVIDRWLRQKHDERSQGQLS